MKQSFWKIFNPVYFIFLYTVCAIVVSVNRFWQYQSFYFDFGIFDMAIWKVAHFKLPLIDHYSLGADNIIIFADHFNPGLFLLSPIYWLTNRPEALLVLQAAIVGLSAYVGYKIASKQIKSKFAVWALVVAYLGYVGLQNALITDFHEITVATLPLMLLFWAYYKKAWKLYFVFLIIFLSFKETFAVLGITIGLFVLIRDFKNWKYALSTILISIVWGIVSYKLIIPYFSNGIYLYTPTNLPVDPSELVSKFISPPLKYQTVFYSFLTFGFLPAFDLSVLPAIFENFFERFVLTGGKGNDLGMHYNALLSPLMFVGALHAFKLMESSGKIRKFVNIYAIFVIIVVIFLHRFILRGPLGLVYNPVFYQQNKNVKYQDDFVSKFPKDGLIMTQNDLAVRLTHYNVKLLRKNYKDFNPQHVFLNLTPGQNPNSYTPLTFEDAVQLKDQLTLDSDYSLTKYGDEQYIFSKLQ